MATYRSVVGPAVDNLEEALERSKATQAERKFKAEMDFKKAANVRFAARLNEAVCEDDNLEIDISEIKGAVGRTGMYGLPCGRVAAVTYSV